MGMFVEARQAGETGESLSHSKVRRCRRTLATLLCVALANGCQRDYRFETCARYEAPLGRYEVAIRARGIVRAGHDVSQEATADVRIAPLQSTTVPAIRLVVTLPHDLAYEVANGEASRVIWPPVQGTFAELLQRHGYDGSADEITELQRAIEGALAGPKGTMMEGQSRSLRVRSVTSGAGPCVSAMPPP
jgi:hypothetical protein